MSDAQFSHLDPLGRARMVDVTPKEPTHRRAMARCKVFMQPSTTAAIANREVKKGDVLAWRVWRASKPRNARAT